LSYEGIPTATVTVPWTPATSDEVKKQVFLGFVHAPVQIVHEDQLAKFVEKLFVAPNATVQMLGLADANTNSSVGEVILSGIEFNESIVAIGESLLEFNIIIWQI